MSDKKNILEMNEEEYREYFKQKFEKERKTKTGIGGMFQALIGTGDKAFIEKVEEMMLSTSVKAREMAKVLAEAAETPEGRQEILNSFRSNFYNTEKPKKDTEEDG
jgi:hypothetical protein